MGKVATRPSAERPHPLLARKSRWAGGRWGCQAALQVDLPPPGDTPEDGWTLPVRGVGGVPPGGVASGGLQALGPNTALLSAHLKSLLQTDSRKRDTKDQQFAASSVVEFESNKGHLMIQLTARSPSTGIILQLQTMHLHAAARPAAFVSSARRPQQVSPLKPFGGPSPTHSLISAHSMLQIKTCRPIE